MLSPPCKIWDIIIIIIITHADTDDNTDLAKLTSATEIQYVANVRISPTVICVRTGNSENHHL